jgi:hypothetical protein
MGAGSTKVNESQGNNTAFDIAGAEDKYSPVIDRITACEQLVVICPRDFDAYIAAHALMDAVSRSNKKKIPMKFEPHETTPHYLLA